MLCRQDQSLHMDHIFYGMKDFANLPFCTLSVQYFLQLLLPAQNSKKLKLDAIELIFIIAKSAWENQHVPPESLSNTEFLSHLICFYRNIEHRAHRYGLFTKKNIVISQKEPRLIQCWTRIHRLTKLVDYLYLINLKKRRNLKRRALHTSFLFILSSFVYAGLAIGIFHQLIIKLKEWAR